MTCNRPGDALPAKNPTAYAPIKAGDTINVQYYRDYECNDLPEGSDLKGCNRYQREWVHCAGPIMVYMANCNGPCENFDGKGKVWFKIQEAGMKDGGHFNRCDFAQGEATHRGWEQGGRVLRGWPVVIPKNLKPGNYLIRHEILMIELNPVQSYPNCANLEVSGTGDAVAPEEYLVEFPGTYSMNGKDTSVVLTGRQRVSINTGWRFLRTTKNPDNLIYDLRPDVSNQKDLTILKPWILPSANDFINDPAKHHQRPTGTPDRKVPFVQATFDDSTWEDVTLPHDWAIKGPFYTEENPIIGGGMGRLPIQGISWYRRKLTMTEVDEGKTIYLDIDGAMSYAMVWLNANLVGGWPYGYNSFRLDLTPYLKLGENQLAIRLDNPVDSSRWYPGGGIYRNVWLTKVNPTHIAQWGTYITNRDVSAQSATIDLSIKLANKGSTSRLIEVATDIHAFDSESGVIAEKVAEFPRRTVTMSTGQRQPVGLNFSATVNSPQLWGPPPTQRPNLYVAVTRLYADNRTLDTYETRFGIRSLTYDAGKGLLVNGELIRIRGVNQHHDLGALGAAFNSRAAERQLEILRNLGSNAIRMSHNPPAPELLDMVDRMGFLVIDEIFDCWERQKNANDFHLIFPDWYEPDLRSFIRRDRNHPSIIAWSFGNEVGEQTTGATGAAVARKLRDIVHEEDRTRPGTASMNAAQPDMPFPEILDLISLNYQGEGIRDTPPYAGSQGITTPPMYPKFHTKFPDKMILSSETAAALSTRGTYMFPVTNEISAPVKDTAGGGGNPNTRQVSAYELYTTPFGSSADKVFTMQDKNPFVAGEFVWSGWDYMGEPTPYYSARSSYFGIIDLAGFKKDRYYLYQSRWRPDLRMAHILPHWTWPNRVGQITPVHVFSAADEAELFLNGKSQGRKRKEASNFRFRWDNVVYQSGELNVVTYKNGDPWANNTVRTTGAASQLQLTADRSTINADGSDLSFITVAVLDSKGDVIPQAGNAITFSLSGPGEIIATDNGDPADMVSFPSKTRKAFNGFALVIVRTKAGVSGSITVTATSTGLSSAQVTLTAQ
ncbi:glycoside hydrolase family 2 protein [Patellaria atrata CBS 101060]|uniref:AA9 family lytic polysaccharide monooxygenase n=1 Tax=Patellaria atrata CBS 101060 TaxID=1346257 RepID=A0A9P4VQN8_9PEZI|nr:glycoside hydrolase family 2 protein [Patellaria atrata CBS 101060]